MQKQRLFGVFNEYNNGQKIKVFSCFGYKLKFVTKQTKYEKCTPRLLKKSIIKKSIESVNAKNINFAVVAIMKNEARDLVEWLEFHLLVGVEHFFLYDNESVDDTYKILEPYIKKGIVTYRYVKGKQLQFPVYRDAIYRYKDTVKWMALIDLDEFLFPVQKKSLVDFMKDYEQYPAVAVNSIQYDCNGVEVRPEKSLLIETFTRMSIKDFEKGNAVIKSIVNPKKVYAVFHPHGHLYKNDELAINENFIPIQKNEIWYTNGVSINKIRLNHYYTKSVQEYMEKVKKGYADQLTKRKFYEERLNFTPPLQNRITQFLSIWMDLKLI